MGGLNVDDRCEEIFAQYNFKIENIYRARGALLLETDKGVKLFRSINSSSNKVQFENNVMLFLQEHGYKNVDSYFPNKENELISVDSQGERYVIKNGCLGDETNLRDASLVKNAAKNLAVLHKILKEVPFAKQKAFAPNQYLPRLYEKHNRELKRVRTYILDKKQKNEFEIRFLNVYDRFYKQAKQAEELLKELDFDGIMNKCIELGTVVHGNYTYHNIIVAKGQTYTTNFDKADVGIQVMDLYYFIRKVMEKNNWDMPLCELILKEYTAHRILESEELKLLYILMLYPEKFWKVTNYYYNGKKSWISQRTIQKLSCLQQQEEVKNIFLQNLAQYCIM